MAAAAAVVKNYSSWVFQGKTEEVTHTSLKLREWVSELLEDYIQKLENFSSKKLLTHCLTTEQLFYTFGNNLLGP